MLTWRMLNNQAAEVKRWTQSILELQAEIIRIRAS